METEEAKAEFVGAAGSIRARWNRDGPDVGLARAEEILAVLFERKSLPPPKLVFVEEAPNLHGSFNRVKWVISINRNFYGPSLSLDLMKELADTLYHEARHCEQACRAIQLGKARGQGNDFLSSTLGVPVELVGMIAKAPYLDHKIAKGAHKTKEHKWSPEQRGAKNRVALDEQWLDEFSVSVKEVLLSGAVPEKIEVETRRREVKSRLEAIQEALAKGPNPDLEEEQASLLKEHAKLYEKYRSWPSEADAWDHGEDVGNRFKARVDEVTRAVNQALLAARGRGEANVAEADRERWKKDFFLPRFLKDRLPMIDALLEIDSGPLGEGYPEFLADEATRRADEVAHEAHEAYVETLPTAE